MSNENIYGGTTYINSSFVFDKICPSLTEAQKNASDDGVLIGRYILIKYCNTAFDYNERQRIEALQTEPQDREEAAYWGAFQDDKENFNVSKDRIVYQKIWNNNGYEYAEIVNLSNVGVSDEIIEATSALNNSAAAVNDTIKEAQSILLALEPVGEKTSYGGEVFGDDTTNQAVSQFTSASGSQTVAGLRGWLIEEYSTNQIDLNIQAKDEITVGDTISLILISNHWNAYEITQIEEAYNGQIVRLTLNSEAIQDLDWNIDTETNYACILTKPQWGDTDLGLYTTAEGYATQAAYWGAHAEGAETKALAQNSHAEGRLTETTGVASHAEGLRSKAQSSQAHAEGRETVAKGPYGSHAEGYKTTAVSMYSHAEGYNTVAGTNSFTAAATRIGAGAHAEGISTQALGDASHSEGYTTVAEAKYAHAEGDSTQALGVASHAEGSGTDASGLYSHAEGEGTNVFAQAAHAEGYNTVAYGDYSHAEGYETQSGGIAAHAEGNGTTALGMYSHAEGYQTTAVGNYSYTGGYSKKKLIDITYTDTNGNTQSLTPTAPSNTIQSVWLNLARDDAFTAAIGAYAHSEGFNSLALANGAHTEGRGTLAAGTYSHAEGNVTKAYGSGSHAEGEQSIATGSYAHAEGSKTEASGNYSHAGGRGTIATAFAQTAIGQWNKESSALFVIGSGTTSARKNAFEVFSDGKIKINEGASQFITINGYTIDLAKLASL